MAFDQERFDKLIQKLEVFAAKQPPIYRLHVALLAVLGYAYIFLILAVTVALLLGTVWIMLNARSFHTSALKLVVFLLAIAFMLVRSLWVTFPPPTGLALRRKDVPSLFCLVDDISSKLQAPRFHHILLTEDFNACVVQRPRLGLFGWYQNYLEVGLPLMLALPPEQFRAVLAHELGHISGNHSRFNQWIYRQRLAWDRIDKELVQGGNESSGFIFKRFLQWYIPFFDAYSFVLARLNEYEADRCAAEIAGVENSAKTLMNFKVKARFIHNNFWNSIYQQVHTEIEPPTTSYTAMQTALAQGIPLKEASTYLAQALAEKTNNADTHPCLTDRLKTLGFTANIQEEFSLSAPVKLSAAQEYLGNSLEKYRDYFSQVWQEQIATPWRQKYAEEQNSLATLEKLNHKSQKQQLTLEEASARALLTFELQGEEAAIPLLREVIKIDQHHASANYLLGQILLRQEDASGIEYIERAIAQDPNMVIEGCQIISYFLQQQGKQDSAKSYQKRAEKYHDLLLKADQERSSLRASDEFQSHNLSEVEVQNICQQLSVYPQVTTAYLVEKVLQYFPDKPLYVLGVVRKTSFWETDKDAKNSELLNLLLQQLKFNCDAFIIVLNNNPNIEKKFHQLPKSLIYQNKK
ncbi:M48 family metalloprotease [Nostoc sp. FACHB-152]|uniref:M48 family metallopeptidase n=1 Tax=unclassified Nostoc TaxID=2593658 RepID=UPI001683F0D5|nr:MULTISPECIES: M48 family metallopeptidase [unclassified Nostoc]MBD2448769.1 M48 family metalloprotease [Nostoc sp. FACHB-152]MBD2467548.1 M48 family metalloprotease [Nostoc sp. FACHB-145]